MPQMAFSSRPTDGEQGGKPAFRVFTSKENFG